MSRGEVFARFYQGKRVLVTGHTGFKGSWLTEWLLVLGAKVSGLALPPPTAPALFDQMGLAGRCDHRIGDIRDRMWVKQAIQDIRPDLVFHLAAQSLVRHSYREPVETYETNVLGTVNVLDALRDASWPCAVVAVTTDKVYENREWFHAYRESDPLGGYDPYSSSKACAEMVIQSYRQSFFGPTEIRRTSAPNGMKDSRRVPPVALASARAGNVIGGGDWALDRIVPDCMRALASGDAVTVRNPRATRPWQHVLEPLSGYLLLGMRLHDALQAVSGDRGSPDLPSLCSAFNFGPPPSSNRSVRELVEAILTHWPGRWADVSDPNAPHEARLLSLATDKAFHALGWRPRWDFDQTLAATVSWYRTVHASGAGVAHGLVRQQIESYSCRGGSLPAS